MTAANVSMGANASIGEGAVSASAVTTAKGIEGTGWPQRLVALILLGALAFVLGMIFWRLFAPIMVGETRPAPARPATLVQDYTILTRFNPFSRDVMVAAQNNSPVGETSLNVTLLGLWSEPDGRGAVILRLDDGREEVFETGDDIAPGVRLLEVRPGIAIISRNGVREQITIEWMRDLNRENAQANSSLATEFDRKAVQEVANQGRAAFLSVAGVRAVRDAQGRQSGYEIYPLQGDAALNAYGLYAGDKIMMINDEPVPVDPKQFIDLLQRLPDGPVSLLVDRGGTMMAVQVEAGK